MQQAMGQFATIKTPAGSTLSLAVKVAVTSGPVRRFRVGDPRIQYIDVLAGATLDRLAAAEKQAQQGEVVVGPETIAAIGDKLVLTHWRNEKGDRIADTVGSAPYFAVVTGLIASPQESTPVNFQEFTQVLATSSTFDEPHLTEDQVRPWLLPPVYERLRAGQGRFLAEIRPAVALFLSFGGLDYDHDDAAGEKLDAYIRLVQNILAYYEGHLIQLTIGEKGSYLYAVFGAPLAHDDDPRRAVAAALELRSPPAELDFSAGTQIGISQGRLWAGAYGTSTRCTYGVLGDEVNVAAWLMQQAKSGQIIVSQHIADAVAKDYRLEYLGSLPVKGRQEPVPSSTVLGRRLPSLPRMADRFANPLTGREGELVQMAQILATVLEGEGQILRLEGVAGVGKSHLAAEFIKQAVSQGLQVAVGACQSTSQDIAYYPWRQIFRSLFDLTDQLAPGDDWDTLNARQISQVQNMVSQSNPSWGLRLPLLGDLLDLPIPDNTTTRAFDPKLRQEALFSLVVDLVQTWARAQPLLLLIEDAHWLDEASQGLTLALGRIIANVPILLVLVHRSFDKPLLPDLDRLPEHNHLYLRELPLRWVASLVTHRLQGKPSALVLALIQILSQGNPFFAEELTKTLHESGFLFQGDDEDWTLSETLFNTLREANCLAKDALRGEWVLAHDAPLSAVDLNIPDSIYGLVLSSLDHLTEATKLTLKTASVIGRTFQFDLLAQSHPTQPDQAVLLEHIRVLEAQDLIHVEMDPTRLTYAFKHHIIQETIYETLPRDQQRDLHRAVAEALERLHPDEAVERLAYHYRHSGERLKALFYLDKAAHKAQREYVNETALNYFNQALALEERWTWRQQQVEILHLLGRRQEEAAGLQVLKGNPAPPVFEIAYLHGQYFEAIGHYPQAQAAVEQALAASRESGELEGMVRCLAHLGLIAYRQGDHEGAKTWYNQALVLYQADRTYPARTEQAFVQVFNGLGFVHSQQGTFDQAQRCYEQALALSQLRGDKQGEAFTLNYLGVTAFYQRHFAEAQTYFQQALTIRRTIGDRAGEGTTLNNLAQLMCDAGDYGQAEAYLSAALTILQATGNRWHEVNVWNDLGILYQELGELSRARSCLEQGLQLAMEMGIQKEKASYLLSNLGLVMRDQGELSTAESLLSEGLALMQAADNKHQISFFLTYLSTIHLQAGRLDQAVKQAEAALNLHKSLDLTLRTTDDLATLAAAHLAAGEVRRALPYAEQALAILEECHGEGPEFPQRDYFIGYQVLKAAGQPDRARAALASAYNLVVARADKITDPALRQSFLQRVTVNQAIVAEYRQLKG
jgi:tetratricopeptide (TPR) repeat protein/class 3 adenylate cyclase